VCTTWPSRRSMSVELFDRLLRLFLVDLFRDELTVVQVAHSRQTLGEPLRLGELLSAGAHRLSAPRTVSPARRSALDAMRRLAKTASRDPSAIQFRPVVRPSSIRRPRRLLATCDLAVVAGRVGGGSGRRQRTDSNDGAAKIAAIAYLLVRYF
jgi:hypothetical protein